VIFLIISNLSNLIFINFLILIIDKFNLVFLHQKLDLLFNTLIFQSEHNVLTELLAEFFL